VYLMIWSNDNDSSSEISLVIGICFVYRRRRKEEYIKKMVCIFK
jgi:hypothetical protein